MIDDLIKYYQNLLIVQYHEKPNAKKEIALATKTFCADDIFSQIVFDVDISEGKQLDLIGKIVGLSRRADGFTFDKIFYSYDDISKPMANPQGKGMSDIGKEVTAIFKDYDDVRRSVYRMTDGQYRKMIKLKILANNGKATNKYVDEALYKAIGDGIKIIDNEDMSITINIKREFEFDGRLAEHLNLLPKPLGVKANIIYGSRKA